MTARNKNVPALRFKGFDNDWGVKTLGTLGTFKNGLNKDSSDFGFGIPFVNLMDVFGKSILEEANFGLVNASERDVEMYSLLKGDVLFIRSSVKRSGVGETILVAKDLPGIVYSGFLIRFRDSGLDLELNFKKFCFSNTPFRNELLSFATSSANTNINQESLAQIKIHFPSLPEQQKIASFLSAIDEKIRQLTRKKELLEQYKKGVMQQLFSGKLRFRDENGKAYPKLVEDGLGKHIDLISGFAFKGEDISEKPGGVPLMRGINITEGLIRHSEEIDRYFHGDAKNMEDLYLKEGDLVVGMDGSKVGKNSALITKFDKGALLVQRVARIRSLKTSDIRFIYQHIRSSRFIQYVDTVNTSSGIPHISSKQIKDFKISFPVKAEQEKIANFLSSIDTKIESVSKQIGETQKFKKGLLQQMFV